MKRTWSRLIVAAIALTLVTLVIGCAGSSYYVRSAKLHIGTKNYDEALKVLQEGSTVAPNDADPELWYTMGQLYFEKKQWAEMNEAFSKSLELDPRFETDIKKTRYNAWQRLASSGVQAFQQGDYAKAIESFQTALVVRPNNDETLANLGLCYLKQDDFENAVESFKQSIQYDDSEQKWVTKQNLLEVYRLMENYEAVVELATDIIANADTLTANRKITVIQSKAIALQRLGKTDEAVAAWDALIAADPTNANFVFNKALLLDILERYDEAAVVYLKAIELNPSDNEARMRAANALLGNQQWETIKKVLEPWLFPDGVKVYEPEFTDLHTWMTLKAAYANLGEDASMKVVDEILKKISD